MAQKITKISLLTFLMDVQDLSPTFNKESYFNDNILNWMDGYKNLLGEFRVGLMSFGPSDTEATKGKCLIEAKMKNIDTYNPDQFLTSLRQLEWEKEDWSSPAHTLAAINDIQRKAGDFGFRSPTKTTDGKFKSVNGCDFSCGL